MKAAPTVRRKPPPATLDGIEQLSGLVAHELNNIAVPLTGFVEMVAENLHDAGAIRQCLDEVQIGIDRLAEIAFELQGLAEPQGVRAPAPIIECLLAPPDQAPDAPPRTLWARDPQARVAVDVLQAQRAVRALVRMTQQNPVLSIGDALAARSVCASCGARLSPARSFVQVRVRAVRGVIVSAIREPFRIEHKLRTAQRLMIAAFVKAAHLSGGHVIAIDGTDCVSVVFPKA